MEMSFVPTCPVCRQCLVDKYDTFIMQLLRIVKNFSIHRFQLGFVNDFIKQIYVVLPKILCNIIS